MQRNGLGTLESQDSVSWSHTAVCSQRKAGENQLENQSSCVHKARPRRPPFFCCLKKREEKRDWEKKEEHKSLCGKTIQVDTGRCAALKIVCSN